MASMIEHVRALSQDIGVRPANTEEEERASHYIKDALEESGYEATLQEFDVPTANRIVTLVLLGIMAVGMLLAFIGTGVLCIIGACLELVAAAIYILEALGIKLISGLFSNGRSQNVIARHIPAEANDRTRKIVVIAHYDTDRNELQAMPFLARIYPIIRLVLVALMVVGFLCALIHGLTSSAGDPKGFLGIVCLVVAIVLFIATAVAAANAFFLGYSAGANSNASGVSVVLGLADCVSGAKAIPGLDELSDADDGYDDYDDYDARDGGRGRGRGRDTDEDETPYVSRAFGIELGGGATAAPARASRKSAEAYEEDGYDNGYDDGYYDGRDDRYGGADDEPTERVRHDERSAREAGVAPRGATISYHDFDDADDQQHGVVDSPFGPRSEVFVESVAFDDDYAEASSRDRSDRSRRRESRDDYASDERVSARETRGFDREDRRDYDERDDRARGSQDREGYRRDERDERGGRERDGRSLETRVAHDALDELRDVATSAVREEAERPFTARDAVMAAFGGTNSALNKRPRPASTSSVNDSSVRSRYADMPTYRYHRPDPEEERERGREQREAEEREARERELREQERREAEERELCEREEREQERRERDERDERESRRDYDERDRYDEREHDSFKDRVARRGERRERAREYDVADDDYEFNSCEFNPDAHFESEFSEPESDEEVAFEFDPEVVSRHAELEQQEFAVQEEPVEMIDPFEEPKEVVTRESHRRPDIISEVFEPESEPAPKPTDEYGYASETVPSISFNPDFDRGVSARVRFEQEEANSNAAYTRFGAQDDSLAYVQENAVSPAEVNEYSDFDSAEAFASAPEPEANPFADTSVAAETQRFEPARRPQVEAVAEPKPEPEPAEADAYTSRRLAHTTPAAPVASAPVAEPSAPKSAPLPSPFAPDPTAFNYSIKPENKYTTSFSFATKAPTASIAFEPEPSGALSSAPATPAPSVAPAAAPAFGATPAATPAASVAERLAGIPAVKPAATPAQANSAAKSVRESVAALPDIPGADDFDLLSFNVDDLEAGKSAVSSLGKNAPVQSQGDNSYERFGAANAGAEGVSFAFDDDFGFDPNASSRPHIDFREATSVFDPVTFNAPREGRVEAFEGRYTESQEEKKRGLKGLFSKRHREDAGSIDEWLDLGGRGAREFGKEIGTWDNFNEDESDPFGRMGGGASRAMYRDDPYASTRQASKVREEVTSEAANDLTSKEIWFVALGASEIGNIGMREFLKENAQDLRNAIFINLDCVGTGTLCTLKKEGFLKSIAADSRLVTSVRAIASGKRFNYTSRDLKERNTDVALALKAGYRAMTLSRAEGGIMPLRNTAGDTADMVVPECLEETLEVVCEVISRL